MQEETMVCVYQRSNGTLGGKRLVQFRLPYGFLLERTGCVSSDVAVSTAAHEFFGIGMVEAAAAGAYPLVPRKLAYPEVFGTHPPGGCEDFFYDGGPDILATRLVELAARVAGNDLWRGDPDRARRCVSRFASRISTQKMDAAIAVLAS